MLQPIDLMKTFTNFSGNAEELIAASAQLANELRLLPDDEHSPRADEISAATPAWESESQDTGNERLLRHYVSMKVVDRPTRQGRDALYGYRHLLQFLTARRLLLRGFGLAKIAQYTSVVPTQSLADALVSPPHRSEAELLVTAYKTSDQLDLDATKNPKNRSVAGKLRTRLSMDAPVFSAPLTPETMHGMADLVHEVDKLRHRFRKEMEEIQTRFQNSLAELQKTLDYVQQGRAEQSSLQLVCSEPKQSLSTHVMESVMTLTETIKINDHRLRDLLESRLEKLQSKLEESSIGTEKLVDRVLKELLTETELNRAHIAALAQAIEMHAEQLEKIKVTTPQSHSGDR